MTPLRSGAGTTAGRAATRELAEFVAEESQRDAGMKMLTTENTPVNGGDITVDDTEVVSFGKSMAVPDSFEKVLTVVGEHVVVEVFHISFDQHFLSSVMGAVLLNPDRRTQPKMASSDHVVPWRGLFCWRRRNSGNLMQCDLDARGLRVSDRV